MSENRPETGRSDVTSPDKKGTHDKRPETKETDKKEEEKSGSKRGLRFSGVPHPLDKQNELEREIQLVGSQDPENYKMLDGRTLAEVQKANEAVSNVEGEAEHVKDAKQTREISIPEYTKTGELVMTKVGNILDVSEPPPLETEGEASPRQTLPGDTKKPGKPTEPPAAGQVDSETKSGTK
jgi:hypothetical protein